MAEKKTNGRTIPMKNSHQIESSNQDSISKCHCMLQSNAKIISRCSHCKRHIKATEMVKHLETCYSFKWIFESPDGVVTEISHENANEITQPLSPNPSVNFPKSYPSERDMIRHRQQCLKRCRVIQTSSNGTLSDHPTALHQINNVSANQANSNSIFCSHCGNLRQVSNRMAHAEPCQKVTLVDQSSDGSIGIISYAGPNDDFVKQIRQGGLWHLS